MSKFKVALQSSLTALISFLAVELAYAQSPNWSVNSSQYQYSMIATVALDLNCVELANINNEVAAFAGNSVRGAATTSTVVGGRYIVSMSIYSDAVNGEPISFRFYDTVSDSIYFSLDSLIFQDNSIVGNPASPLVLQTNRRPSIITISSDSIEENNTVGTAIGALITIDSDVNQTHSYSLVNGLGSTDNALFSIRNDSLIANFSADYDVKTNYQIRLRATDSKMCSLDSIFTIVVKDVNFSPTSIQLSSNQIMENRSQNSEVGSFTATDPDANDSFTFQLINGLGGSDNSDFSVVGNKLQTASIFNFEIKTTYSIRVEVMDSGGSAFVDTFKISVTDTNDIPTDIAISAASIIENADSNTLIATFSTIDEDVNQLFTYAFVNTSVNDNNSFSLTGNELRVKEPLNFETKNSYTLDVQADDGNGGLYQKQFTISVRDTNETQTDISLTSNSIVEKQPNLTYVGKLSSVDEDFSDMYTYSLVNGQGDIDNSGFSISNDSLYGAVAFDALVKNPLEIRVRSTDQVGIFLEKQLLINVIDVNDPPTDIVISSDTIDENVTASSLIATFRTIDADTGQTFTYTFDNSVLNDNSSFSLFSNQLRVKDALDHESKSSYIVSLESNDGNGGSIRKQFIINVRDVNELHTDILLSSKMVIERQAPGEYVGRFSSVDQDISGTYSYELVNGVGDEDNADFEIRNDSLLTKVSLYAIANNIRNIRIRSTDTDNQLIERQFLIQVIDTNDAPTDILISNTVISEFSPILSNIATFSTVDQDTVDMHTYRLSSGVGDQDNSAFTISGDKLLTNVFYDFETKNSYSIRVESSDRGGLQLQKTFVLQIANENEKPIIENQTFNIEENNAIEFNLGKVEVDDFDENEVFIYSVIEGQNVISIDRNSGEMILLKSLDYEAEPSLSFTIVVRDKGGLSDTAEINIQVIDQIENELPAAEYFSPNGDGRNDTWKIQNVDLYRDYGLTIFTTNGKVVYKVENNYTNNWDGTDGGTELAEGVYYFLFENKANGDIYKGIISLKR